MTNITATSSSTASQKPESILGLPCLRTFAVYAQIICDETNVHAVSLNWRGIDFTYDHRRPSTVSAKIEFDGDGAEFAGEIEFDTKDIVIFGETEARALARSCKPIPR